VAAAGILFFLCAETDFFLSFPALALLEFSFTFFCCYGLSSASSLSPLSILFSVFSLKSSPVFLLCFFFFRPLLFSCYNRARQFSKQIPLCFPSVCKTKKSSPRFSLFTLLSVLLLFSFLLLPSLFCLLSSISPFLFFVFFPSSLVSSLANCHGVISPRFNCHGVIFCSTNKPVRQPSPSLDSAFPRQSHSCLPSN